MSRPTYTAGREPLSELVARVDLAELVERYTGTAGKGGAHKWLFPCPNPDHPDDHPSFTVTRMGNGRQLAHCWSGCNWKGDALALVQWLDGCTVAEAATRLRAHLGESEPRTWDRAPGNRTAPKPAPVHRPTVTEPDNAHTPSESVAGRVMREHLAGRGWPDTVPELFGLTVVLDTWGKPRIRYPYHAWDGTRWAVCSWQDRGHRNDQRPKYMTPKGAVLPPYNVRALDTLTDLAAVVVCEGAPDTITATLALAGRTDIVAVGIAGVNAWRTEWAPMLAAPVVIVAADPDKAGETLTDAIMRDLGRPVIVLDLVGGDLTETAKAHGLAAVTALLTATVDEATSVVDKPPAVHEPATQGATPVTTGTVEPVRSTATDVMPAPPLWWDRWTALEALGPHRWKVCSTCGEGALASLGRKCLMTPECEGRYVTRAPQGVSV